MSALSNYPKYVIRSPSSSAEKKPKLNEVEWSEATLSSWRNGDLNVVYEELVIKKSSVVEYGYGVYSKKTFSPGDIITEWCYNIILDCDLLKTFETDKGVGSFINVSDHRCNVKLVAKDSSTSYVIAVRYINAGTELFYPFSK
jgi:hypothetical protein